MVTVKPTPAGGIHSPRPVGSAERRASGPVMQHIEPAGGVPMEMNVGHVFREEVAGLRQRVHAAPRDTVALRRLGQLWQDAHRPGAAAGYYRLYLAIAPGSRDVWLDLTHCYATLEQWGDAAAAARALLEQYPDDPAAMYNLGALHANRGEAAEARRWWQRVHDTARDTTMVTLADAGLRRLSGKR